tara:strand:+ start:412 stop:621 length:210 start_codon:yes stop_codon:yes gene_type:complete
MNSKFKHNNHAFSELPSPRTTDIKDTKIVNVRVLVARLKEEKKNDKKKNLILSVAAVSAVTAFGIILTL